MACKVASSLNQAQRWLLVTKGENLGDRNIERSNSTKHYSADRYLFAFALNKLDVRES